MPSQNSKLHVRNATAHAIQRAYERYGVRLSPADLRHLSKQIRSNRARHLEQLTHTRSFWEVSYRGTVMRAIYSKTLQQIVTFLPLNMVPYDAALRDEE